MMGDLQKQGWLAYRDGNHHGRDLAEYREAFSSLTRRKECDRVASQCEATGPGIRPIDQLLLAGPDLRTSALLHLLPKPLANLALDIDLNGLRDLQRCGEAVPNRRREGSAVRPAVDFDREIRPVHEGRRRIALENLVLHRAFLD